MLQCRFLKIIVLLSVILSQCTLNAAVLQIVPTNGYNIIKLKRCVPLAEQMTKENTIYIVNSRIDLGGDTVRIPINSALRIKKGALLNGKLVGANTSIESVDKCVFENVIFEGTWTDVNVYPEWFGAKGDGKNDDAEAIQQAAYLAANNSLCFKSGRKYLCRSGVLLKSHTDVYGNGAVIIKACYSSIFRNEHFNDDIIDHDINLFGLSGITLNNNYRGLWIWLVGVKDCQIKDCSFTNNTPIDKAQQPQWCMTLSGEDIEIANCVINTRGGGLFSDGIHFYNAANCRIHHCEISTDDDCIGFCPELSEKQRNFKKFCGTSTNIQIINSVLSSTNNCIRFEIRDNAPTVFSYNNVTIQDITLGGKGVRVGSFLYIHDYRKNNTSGLNMGFKIENIQCAGIFEGGKRNFIEIYGKNPETLPTGVCNISGVQVSGIMAKLKGFENYVRVIGVDGFKIKDCFFDVEGDYRTGVSLRDATNINIDGCVFTTCTPYTFLDVVSCTGFIKNNTIKRITPANNAGIAISIDNLSEGVDMEKNAISNFAIGFRDKRRKVKTDSNKYEKCNLRKVETDSL